MATDSTLLSAGYINAEADHGAAGNDMDFGGVQLAAAKPEGTVPVELPRGQQIVVIPVQPGQTIELPTDSPDGLLAKIGADGNLAIIVDGRTIILQGFVAANDAQPITIVTNDGDIVDITDVIAGTLPDVALDIQTAAGPAAGPQAGAAAPGGDASGSGIFVPFAAGPLLGGFTAAGVLGATQLAYKNIDDEQRFFVKEEESNDLPKSIEIVPEEGQPVAEDGSFLLDEDFLKDGNQDLPAPSPQDDAGSASAAGFVVVDFGLDGPRAVDPILMDPIVGGNGTPSGLFTTDGTPILLHLDAASGGQQVLHGYLTNPGVDDAFVLILNTTTGQFQLVLNESLQHDENSFEDNVALDVVFSAFDANNDQQSATLHLSFDDDMPEITAGEGQFKLALDETTTRPFVPAGTDYNDPNFDDDGVQDGSTPEDEVIGKLPLALLDPAYGPILGAAQSDASGLFSVQFGADNAALSDSEEFEFTILNPDTLLKDTETGEFVTLVDKGNGLVEGQISGGVVVFALTIDSNGFVSMAQYRALDHGDEEAAPGAHDEVVSLGTGFLAVTLTATDGDGDQASKTVDIGGGVTFDDDGPTWLGWSLSNGSLDEDALAGGIPGGLGDSIFVDNLKATGQINFDLGNDTGGSLSIADLTVKDDHNNTIALADLRTADGHEIIINKSVDAGTGLITWVGVIQGGPNDGDPAFTITLDGAGANIGAFTFELQAPLDHPSTDFDGQNNGPETAYEDNLQFTFTVAATDGDGDIAYAQPFTVLVNDDSPQILLKDAAIQLAVDETVGGNGTDVDDLDYPFPPQDGTTIENDEDLVALPQVLKDYGDVIGAATADASTLFSVQFGADGGAATDPESFSLKILNPDTGLFDTASGDPIVLVNNNGVIEGRAYDGDDTTIDPVVFALTVDQDGNISMAQYRAIDHGDEEENESGEDGAFDEVLYLGTGKLAVEISATDADGDKVTLSSDLGNAISFDDDGPEAVDDTDSVTEDGPIVATGNVLTGIDGGLGADENGEDGVADTVGSDGFQSISWAGAVAGAIDSPYGKLFVDANGNYKYELDNTNPLVQDLTEGETKQEVFTYTITDGDGDQSTATLTITITGKNDGPTIDFFPNDPNVKNGAAVVSDEGLAGSNPDSDPVPDDETNSKIANGTFLVSDPDAGDVLTVVLLTTGLPALSFAGQVVAWSVDPDGHTLRGKTGGTDAITVEISSVDGFNYNYTVTLLKPLDHPDDTIEDELDFNVAVKVTDLLGASDTALLNIEIEDDSPVVTPGFCGTFLLQVDETVNGAGASDVNANGDDGTPQDGSAAEGDEVLNAAAVVTAGLNALGTAIGAATSSTSVLFSGTPGADGEKSHLYDLQILNGGLTALRDTATGELIQLIEEGGFIKGVTQTTGALVFAIHINDQTGQVTMAQYRAIDHGTDAPVSYPDEVLALGANLLQVTYSITDKDDDVGSLSKDLGDAITFDDDGPLALKDADSVTEDGPTIATGNVVTAADGGLGSDANGTDGVADAVGSDGFQSISWAGAVAGAIDSPYGKLFVDANGNYKYELDNTNPLVQDLTEGETKQEVFTYTITDGDGDTSTATLTITITGKNDGPRIDLFPEDPNTDDRTAVVSDEGLPGANPDATGQPTDDTNSKIFVGNLTVSDPDVGDVLTVSMLNTGTFPGWTFGGNPVSWVLSPDGLTLTGTAGGNPALTVVIAPSGVNAYTYTVTQFQQLDHPLTNDPSTPAAEISFEDELAFNITVQVKDSTNATDTAILTIQVEDDSPVNNSATISKNVVEDGLATGLSTGNGGGTTVAVFTAAELATLVNSGADVPASIKLNLAIDNVDSGLDSKGDSIIYDYVDATHINGVAGGRTVFTIVEAPAGTFTFTLLDQIDHGPLDSGTGDAETTALSLASVFVATDKDGDSVVIDAGASVNIENDIPVNNAVTISKNVVEDGLTGLSTGIGGGTTVATFTAAELATLVAPGADEGVTIKLNPAIDGVNSGLDSKGVDIFYNYVDATHIEGVAGGRTVFTIVEAPVGTFTFTLLDQIDHTPNDSGTGDGETISLSLASVFTATDFDGDTIIIDAGASVVIENDIPANNAVTISKNVFEDGLATALSTGIGGGTTVATFTAAELTTLVAPGADEGVTISLNPAIDNVDSGLNSKGFDIIYDYVDATHVNGVADGRIVFTIVESPVGTFTFTLLDQVDHGALDSGTGDAETTTLSLALVFRATDFDGDSIAIDAGASVVIENDIPQNNAATISKNVVEDGLTGLSTGIGGGATTAVFTAAELAGLVSPGADEGVTIKLNLNIEGVDSGLDSKGQNILFDYVDATHVNGVAGGRTVFTIVEAPAGTFTFTLLDQIDHTPLATGGGDAETISLSLASVFTATDFDGDTIVIDAGASVVIENDVPVNYDPQNQSLLNFAGGSISGALNLAGKIGADEPASIVFSGFANGDVAKDTGGKTLTSGGQTIELNGVGTTTLTGYVDANNNNIVDAGETVFTATLNAATDTYQFTLVKDIDDGTSVTTLSFNDVEGGNDQWFFFDANAGASTNQDVLVTSRFQDGQTANTSATDIGVSNQWIGDPTGQDPLPEGVRLDFALNVNGGADLEAGLNQENGFLFTDHFLVNNAAFTVAQLKGSGDTTIQVRLSDTNLVGAKTAGTTYAQFLEQTTIAILGLVVTNGLTTKVLGTDYTVLVNPDGSWTIGGLDAGDKLTFNGAASYDRIEVDYVSGQAFAINGISYEEATAGNPLNVQFQTTLTDFDGDTSTGAIDVNLQPADNSNDAFTGAAGNDVLFGGGGNDTMSGNDGNDTLNGGAGNDTISGGNGLDTIIGGTGNDALSGGAGSDTFVYQTLNDGKDAISDFDIAAPASGGDKLDISAVLDLAGNTWSDGGTLATAVTGGYITFTNSGGFVQVNVDIDGSGGGAFAPTALAVLTNLAFVSAAQAQTDLTDNVVVG